MNSFGRLFKITTFGESHGRAVGVVIDGCPSGVELNEGIVDAALAERRPSADFASTARKEADSSEILSGVFDGYTTGVPISILIKNTDARSADYEQLKDLYRPGHADYTYDIKYGRRDWRGGGRASGRETAARVAAGAVARQYLSALNISVYAHTVQLADIEATEFDAAVMRDNPFRCADSAAAHKMTRYIEELKAEGDSCGGIVRLCISNAPAGLGEPLFDKLDARLAYAMMGIGAVKGVEIGEGFAAASLKGSENNDQLSLDGFLSNHAGGILGGISSAQDIVLRVAVKPVPTISKAQQTITQSGEEITFSGTGRHDICIVPRVIPVIEAMAWLVLADMYMLATK